MRQLGYRRHEITDALTIHDAKLGRFLSGLMPALAEKLECEVKDLRLDHNPALALRKKILNGDGEIIGYIPPEHSPDDYEYRSNHGHHIKTNVAGDGAQHSDRVLMKKNRRLEKREREAKEPKNRHSKQGPIKPRNAHSLRMAFPRGRKIQSRGFERRK